MKLYGPIPFEILAIIYAIAILVSYGKWRGAQGGRLDS